MLAEVYWPQAAITEWLGTILHLRTGVAMICGAIVRNKTEELKPFHWSSSHSLQPTHYTAQVVKLEKGIMHHALLSKMSPNI